MDVKKLALRGLISGLMLSTLTAQEILEEEQDIESSDDPNSENAGYYLMSEEELIQYLNPKSREIYQNLSEEGKKLALEEASRRCNGTNSCKGLNACKTEDNACAGKGDCKGKSKCTHSDKNLVIKLVAEKMAKKRNSL